MSSSDHNGGSDHDQNHNFKTPAHDGGKNIQNHRSKITHSSGNEPDSSPSATAFMNNQPGYRSNNLPANLLHLPAGSYSLADPYHPPSALQSPSPAREQQQAVHTPTQAGIRQFQMEYEQPELVNRPTVSRKINNSNFGGARGKGHKRGALGYGRPPGRKEKAGKEMPMRQRYEGFLKLCNERRVKDSAEKSGKQSTTETSPLHRLHALDSPSPASQPLDTEAKIHTQLEPVYDYEDLAVVTQQSTSFPTPTQSSQLQTAVDLDQSAIGAEPSTPANISNQQSHEFQHESLNQNEFDNLETPQIWSPSLQLAQDAQKRVEQLASQAKDLRKQADILDDEAVRLGEQIQAFQRAARSESPEC